MSPKISLSQIYEKKKQNFSLSLVPHEIKVRECFGAPFPTVCSSAVYNDTFFRPILNIVKRRYRYKEVTYHVYLC